MLIILILSIETLIIDLSLIQKVLMGLIITQKLLKVSGCSLKMFSNN